MGGNDDRQNSGTGHLRVAKRGSQDRPRAGGATAGGLRQRDRGAVGVHLPLEAQGRVGQGVFAANQDEQGAVREVVLELHSYQVPEIIALPIAAGSRTYLDWISASVKS